MKTLFIIAAQTATPPLPGKALLPLAGAPVLERMVQRVLSASADFQLVVATSTEPEDEALRELCRRIDVKCAAGHPGDLLDRVFQIACNEKADQIGLIPLSSPLVDPAIVDMIVQFAASHEGEFDYVSNLHPPSYPAGNDVELLPISTMETLWKEARQNFERWYITPYCWDNPARFRVANVRWPDSQNLSMSHRWCLEFPEDYLFIRAVFDELWSVRKPIFSLQEIMGLARTRPDLVKINAHLAGVNWYRNHLRELKTIKESDTRSPISNPEQRSLTL